MNSLPQETLILAIKILWFLSISLMLLETFSLRKSIQSIWQLSAPKFLLIYAGIGLGSLFFITLGFNIWMGLLLIFGFLYMNYQYHGTFNGGSCMIQLTVLVGLVLMTIQPKVGLLWIGLQGLLSYWVAGLGKLKDKNWRSGFALKVFINQSPYSPSRSGHWLEQKNLWQLLSLITLTWECCFPLVLWLPASGFITAGLLIFIFHLFNAYLFGLNRFTWSWLSVWPGIWYLAIQVGQINL